MLKDLRMDTNLSDEFVGYIPPKPPQDELTRIAAEYKSQPLTSESVNKFWQTFWKVKGAEIDHVFDVPGCIYDRTLLVELEKDNRAVLLIPDEIYRSGGLALLAKMFPEMPSRTVPEGSTLENKNYLGGGCFDVEMDLEVQHGTVKKYKYSGHTIMDDLEVGQREETYIVASQFSKLLTGHYFDEKTSFRVPGFRSEGRVVYSPLSSDVLYLRSRLVR